MKEKPFFSFIIEYEIMKYHEFLSTQKKFWYKESFK